MIAQGCLERGLASNIRRMQDQLLTDADEVGALHSFGCRAMTLNMVVQVCGRIETICDDFVSFLACQQPSIMTLPMVSVPSYVGGLNDCWSEAIQFAK